MSQQKIRLTVSQLAFIMAGKQEISIRDATALASESLRKLGYSENQSNIISDHLIDSELRGFGIAGLARILSIADRLKGSPPATATKTTRDAPATAQIDGQDTLGYLVGYEATKLAIEKCKASGVSVVGANGTWYTGMVRSKDQTPTLPTLTGAIAFLLRRDGCSRRSRHRDSLQLHALGRT